MATWRSRAAAAALHLWIASLALAMTPVARTYRINASDAQGEARMTLAYESIFNAAMKASCGMSTLPNWRIFFLPAFCFSSSLRLRVASPP